MLPRLSSPGLTWLAQASHLPTLTLPRLGGRGGWGRTRGSGPRVTSKTPYQPHSHSSDRVMPAPLLALTDLPPRLPPAGALITRHHAPQAIRAPPRTPHRPP